MKSVQTLLEELTQKVEEHNKETDARLLNVEKVLVALDINMTTHMKRSDNLESLYNLVREDVKPLQKHVNHVEGGLKLLGALALLVTIVGGIARLFGVI